MSNPLLAFIAVAAMLTGSPEDGETWLHEVEGRLYAWPKPAAVVRFHVRTDVLGKTIEMLKGQLPPDPTPDMVKTIDALRRIEITGTIDTGTGEATTQVDIPMDTSDPQRREAVETTRRSITRMVEKSFESLPLHDPRLAGKGRKVLAADEEGDTLTVKVSGKAPGEETTIRIDRRRMLPEAFESGARSMKVRYTEVLPGRFAPARLDIQLPDAAKSSATFTYQRVGDLVFPSTVVVTLGATSARIEFLSVRAEKTGR